MTANNQRAKWITPAKARKLIAADPRPRTLAAAAAQHAADVMRDGRVRNVSAIRLSTDGAILDGLARLTALSLQDDDFPAMPFTIQVIDLPEPAATAPDAPPTEEEVAQFVHLSTATKQSAANRQRIADIAHRGGTP